MPELTPTERFAAEYFTLNSISMPRRHQVLSALDRYEQFLDRPLLEADDNDLRLFLVHLLEADLKANTVNWYLRMLLPFYKWAWQHRMLDADMLMRLRDVSPPRGYNTQLPRPYSRKEIGQLWGELAEAYPLASDLMVRRLRNGTSRFHGPLRRHAMRLQLEAIVELALVCGLRRHEIYSLAIDDVHWDNKYVVVHGKRVDQNDKTRDVPYADSTREAVRAWFRFRGFMAPEPGLPLWLSITGPVANSGLRPERMKGILQSFGDWQLHRLRHTCATERLRAGMELEKLQRFLGHAHIQQTLKYAELVRGDIHKSAARTDEDFQRAIGRPRKAA